MRARARGAGLKKLHSSRGETLVEVLASILVASLSVALLFSCVIASSTADVKVKEVDDTYYAALNDAGKQVGTPAATAKITVNGTELPGNYSVYGGAGVYSYKKG